MSFEGFRKDSYQSNFLSVSLIWNRLTYCVDLSVYDALSHIPYKNKGQIAPFAEALRLFQSASLVISEADYRAGWLRLMNEPSSDRIKPYVNSSVSAADESRAIKCLLSWIEQEKTKKTTKGDLERVLKTNSIRYTKKGFESRIMPRIKELYPNIVAAGRPRAK